MYSEHELIWCGFIINPKGTYKPETKQFAPLRSCTTIQYGKLPPEVQHLYEPVATLIPNGKSRMHKLKIV